MRAAPFVLGALAALVVAVVLNPKRADAKPGETLWTDSMTSWIDNLTQDAAANEARYRPAIRDAELKQGLPAGLLARVVYQESRYRTDIITGEVVSSAGAVGIAQIVPRWHPTVNPLDPVASIYYAASYLRTLYGQFGTWRLALAAYNFGPGNVSSGKPWPDETLAYVSDIAGDVGLA